MTTVDPALTQFSLWPLPSHIPAQWQPPCECKKQSTMDQYSASYGPLDASAHHADEQEPTFDFDLDDISSFPMDADSHFLPPLPVTMNALGDLHTDQGCLMGHGGAQASMMDEDVFTFEQDWLTEGMPNPPLHVQYFGGSSQIAPVQHIDTELLMSPLDLSPPFVSNTDPILIPSQGDPPLMMTPSLTPSSSFPLTASLASEGASPLSPLGLRGSPFSPFSPFSEDSIEGLLKQGYPGDSTIALERCKVLRHAMFNETNQLPTCAREIKKLADIQRLTDDTPEDALPSSAPGKKSPTLLLQCAWAGCDHSCSRPDRLKTHVFTHIGFKPFPCDRSCGDLHCTAKFYSKGDCNSHQTRHEKKRICENCGEECTGKNWQRHARSTKCRNNRRRATSYSM